MLPRIHFLLVPALLASPLVAQDGLPVPRADAAPVIDGRLDDSAWSSAASLADWVQTQPGDNTAPDGETTAFLLHDDDALYIAIRATDPRGIRYTLHPRDQVRSQGQDWVGVLLDTFDDRRQAFGFAINPIGVQGDGIIVEGDGLVEWDAIFESAGVVDPDGRGYAVEIRIPFKSLRFSRRAVQRWGLSMTRGYGRTGAEDTPWPLDRDRGCELCQMRPITLEAVEPGRNLEVNPTMVAGTEARRPTPGEALGPTTGRLEPGLNLKYGLTSNLTLDGTLNPDFSQVESDAGQLEVNNRFALFFPERRPFFLEGAAVFTTSITPPGASPFVRAPINLIHSRTIVDPDWGVKLSGKTGRVGIGAIASRDAAGPLDVPGAAGGADVLIGRTRVDVLEDGYIGAAFTGRRHGGADDLTGGLDARLRVGQNLVLRGLYAASRYGAGAAEPGGERLSGQALQLQADWQSRHWAAGVGLADVSPGFRAPLGFIPRTDQIMATGSLAYIWRRTGWLHRVQPQLRYERIHQHDEPALLAAGDVADELWEPSVVFTFARSTTLGLGMHRAFTRYEGADFPGQDRFGFSFATQALDRLYVEAAGLIGETVIFGDVAEDGVARAGWMRELEATATIRPVPALRTDATLSASRIWRRTDDDPRSSLYADALIPRLRIEYQATRRLGVRAIGQWNATRYHARDGTPAEQTEALSVELLASYVINAGSAIYVGFTELQAGQLGTRLAPERRGGVAKATYVWRF